jgi:hypothetical protein
MFHVGLDIHSTHMTICVLDATGQVVHRSRVRTIEEVIRVLPAFPTGSRSAPRRAAATATSTTGSARWPPGCWWPTPGRCG